METHYPLGENQNLQRKSWNPNANFNSEISTLDRWLATQIVNLHPNRQSHFTLFHSFFFFFFLMLIIIGDSIRIKKKRSKKMRRISGLFNISIVCQL